jgi:hypothetical protein
MMLTMLIGTFFLFKTPFDKIEKQGTLLNASCTLLGTRCSAGSKLSMVQYTYVVNEPGARLILRVSNEEANKSKQLYLLLKNKTNVELSEVMILPLDVCKMLNLPTDYAIPTGFYKVNNINNAFDIQLIK